MNRLPVIENAAQARLLRDVCDELSAAIIAAGSSEEASAYVRIIKSSMYRIMEAARGGEVHEYLEAIAKIRAHAVWGGNTYSHLDWITHL